MDIWLVCRTDRDRIPWWRILLAACFLAAWLGAGMAFAVRWMTRVEIDRMSLQISENGERVRQIQSVAREQVESLRVTVEDQAKRLAKCSNGRPAMGGN